MCGAVLHGLQLDTFVERHLMRRNYGTQLADVFDPNQHPHYLRFVDEFDGSHRCRVLKWYAKKVYVPCRPY